MFAGNLLGRNSDGFRLCSHPAFDAHLLLARSSVGQSYGHVNAADHNLAKQQVGLRFQCLLRRKFKHVASSKCKILKL